MYIHKNTVAELRKLVPDIRIPIQKNKRMLKNPQGALGRIWKISKDVSDLFKEERVELGKERADEVRGYAEKREAIKYGDTHEPTMEIAKFYLQDRTLIHKLFNVFVPRFKDYNQCYTNVYLAPTLYTFEKYPRKLPLRAILELKGHPFPPMKPERIPTNNWIHNILLEEARREYNQKKAAAEKAENEEASSLRAEDEENEVD
ncbi:39S ribosomal protein L17, mitochondrial [Armadillidium nasatum]|uniref:Large ribosomal subunit protein bL17m n=1 Tax=Armadillidium nasatum TaxID=96803 RepID=A0A5N5T305_9CRUS|nr:39S ribosomal protein L17, mitochondrial [Armadillidium nasatum]